jgi:hypothetical protein
MEPLMSDVTLGEYPALSVKDLKSLSSKAEKTVWLRLDRKFVGTPTTRVSLIDRSADN